MHSDALACIAAWAHESAYLGADPCDVCDLGLDIRHFEYCRHVCEAFTTARPMQNRSAVTAIMHSDALACIACSMGT